MLLHEKNNLNIRVIVMSMRDCRSNIAIHLVRLIFLFFWQCHTDLQFVFILLQYIYTTYIVSLKQMLGPITFAAPVITLKLNSELEHVIETEQGFLFGLLIPE